MKIYSHSKLESFESCPLKYKYQYIDKIKSDRDGIEAFMGSRCHDALEKLYSDLKLSKLNSEEETVAFYQQSWEKNWHDNVFIVRKDYTADNYRETGEKAVRDYYRHYAPFDQGKSIWTEQNIRIKLDGAGEYAINGYVDRLDDMGNGIYEVHDYKSSGTLASQEEKDRDRQLALYQLAVEDFFSDVEQVELVWHYLIFDKEIRSTRTRQQLGFLKKKIIELIDVIEATEEFEANECGLCSWCDYQDLCPRRKHLFVVEQLPVQEFKADDGVQLVDRWADLKQQEKLVKDEIEKLRADVLAYSRQFEVEKIRGSSGILPVKISNVAKFPEAKSKLRPELEALIKELNHWEDASSLDTRKLARLYQQKLWPEDELARLHSYVWWETSEQVGPLSKARPIDPE